MAGHDQLPNIGLAACILHTDLQSAPAYDLHSLSSLHSGMSTGELVCAAVLQVAERSIGMLTAASRLGSMDGLSL